MTPPAKPTCEWKPDDYPEYRSHYETECGNTFVFIDGTPSDNQMRYCCYCGRPLTHTTAPSAGRTDDAIRKD